MPRRGNGALGLAADGLAQTQAVRPLRKCAALALGAGRMSMPRQVFISGGFLGDTAAFLFEGATEQFGPIEVLGADEVINDNHQLSGNPGADELTLGASIGSPFCRSLVTHWRDIKLSLTPMSTSDRK